jgi:hypothetical protein
MTKARQYRTIIAMISEAARARPRVKWRAVRGGGGGGMRTGGVGRVGAGDGGGERVPAGARKALAMSAPHRVRVRLRFRAHLAAAIVRAVATLGATLGARGGGGGGLLGSGRGRAVVGQWSGSGRAWVG